MGLTSIAALITKQSIAGEPIAIRTWIVFGMTFIWGMRLALHIGLRHKREDFRYVDMRKRWSKDGTAMGEYYISAYVYIFMLQGLFCIITHSAVFYTVMFSITDELLVTDYIGIAVWAIGLTIETVGD
jgi:steroid 5-alpha reductase family enzyme